MQIHALCDREEGKVVLYDSTGTQVPILLYDAPESGHSATEQADAFLEWLDKDPRRLEWLEKDPRRHLHTTLVALFRLYQKERPNPQAEGSSSG